MNGKGDAPRPYNTKVYGENYNAIFKRYARKARQEIDDWNAANPELRETHPPRFRHKPTDNIRARH